jgi:hypothetical protein
VNADLIKLWFTYGLATVIIVGGLGMLFISRAEANSDFALLIAGFIGAATGFIFNRESAYQATRAAAASTLAQQQGNQQ